MLHGTDAALAHGMTYGSSDDYSVNVAEGMVNITRFTSAAMIIRDRSTWVTVLEKLKDEEMPPEH